MFKLTGQVDFSDFLQAESKTARIAHLSWLVRSCSCSHHSSARQSVAGGLSEYVGPKKMSGCVFLLRGTVRDGGQCGFEFFMEENRYSFRFIKIIRQAGSEAT